MSLIEEFRMYIASYPHAHDCVSTWSSIHVHVNMDTCAEFAYALWATNRRIWYALWAIEQN
jgi:hypothetical protein